MFDRFFGRGDASGSSDTTEVVERPAPVPVDPAGDTATVRRIVATLEALPPGSGPPHGVGGLHPGPSRQRRSRHQRRRRPPRWRRPSSGRAPSTRRPRSSSSRWPSSRPRRVGGTEDFVVTREFKAVSTPEQRLNVVRAAFVIGAANGSISAEESAVANEIANELDIEDATLAALRAEFTEQMSAVQQMREGHGPELTSVSIADAPPESPPSASSPSSPSPAAPPPIPTRATASPRSGSPTARRSRS